jgi:hypothetical protein
MKQWALIFLVGLLFAAGAVEAQRGGGKPTPPPGGRTSRPTLTPQQSIPTKPVTTPVADHPQLTRTPVPTRTRGTPASSDVAETALTSFASQYLGLSPDLSYAGDFNEASSGANLNKLLSQLPPEEQSFLNAVSSISGAMYWGTFDNGLGVVAVGDCSTDAVCEVNMDNLTLMLSSASSGVYSIYTSGNPTTSSDALKLIQTAFPGLAGLSMQAVIDVQEGYAFQAMTSHVVRGSGQVAAEYVFAGVVTSNGQSLVYALVAVGDTFINAAR